MPPARIIQIRESDLKNILANLLVKTTGCKRKGFDGITLDELFRTAVNRLEPRYRKALTDAMGIKGDYIFNEMEVPKRKVPLCK
jgi:hypothetical protein